MLKVWIWKKHKTARSCRVSPTEPSRSATDDASEPRGKRVLYYADQDIIVCSKYIRRITGRSPTLKPRAFWFDGNHRADV